MSVVVSVQDVGPCRKQLTISVPAPAVEAETRRVLEEYGRRVKIPGFRQGKVPTDLLKRRYKKDIEHEVVERLLPRYWRQAQAESEIEPLLPPEVDSVEDLQDGAPLTFVATVETRPAIELRNIRDFDLPSADVEAGEAEVDDLIEDLRRQLGTWATVERPAARGDLVAARVTELHPGEDREGEPQQLDVEVGDQRVWEELTLALQGLAAGQEGRFSRREGGGEGEEAGPERHFRVEVTEVKERELPPLDDDFAKRVSADFGSLAELRAAAERRVKAGKAAERREQRQRALLDQLRERHPMELPQGVVRQETEGLVHEYADTLAQRGVDLEQAAIDWEQVAGQMQPLAERRVHARLLLDAIAEAESIDATESEFESALATLARAQKTSTPALRKSLDEQGRLSGMRSQLRRDKTIRHLLGEIPATAGTAAAAEERS